MASEREVAVGPDPEPEPGPKRRWCIPPAILREPSETLEGAQVLDEVGGRLGVLLWQCLRDVTLWAATDPEDRDGLFASPG
ncbi:MAG TPA: hypothetical protein VFH27_17550, partial [Longimicrobiaceae bacterium]|nr:hypothetical protein [Longimicrobiaceae bacterium]